MALTWLKGLNIFRAPHLGVGMGRGHWEDSCSSVFPKEYEVTPSNCKCLSNLGHEQQPISPNEKQVTDNSILIRVARKIR